MLSLNLLQLVHQLDRITDVRVHDTTDALQLHMPSDANMEAVDDLLCDAVFAEPEGREITRHGWVIHLNKLARRRSVASDMQVVRQGDVYQYVLGAA